MKETENQLPQTSFLLYQTEDGKAQVRLRAANVLKEEELAEDSVIKESLITATGGKSSCQGILDNCHNRGWQKRFTGFATRKEK